MIGTSLRRRRRIRPLAGDFRREARIAADPDVLFTFDGVRVERGGRTVLDLGHLEIPVDGATAIVGPSGSGKSTLLRLCNRLEAPTDGTISYRGVDLAVRDATDLRRSVAMVFQQPVALEGSVAANLREADPSIDGASIDAALARVGLPGDLVDRPARDLSGGERQRLGLARSLSTDPQVLLLDEATSALDPTNAAHIEQLVVELADQGITPIWVTHDLGQLVRIAQHVIVIVAGRVVQHGEVASVLAAPKREVARFLQGQTG